jgi:uncharacterized cupin superfamily protein
MSEPIERFTNWCAVSHGHDMAPTATGLWVRYSDYQRELSAAKERIAELRKDAERLARGNYQRKMNAIAAMWPCSPGTVERIRNEAIDEFAAIDAAKESGDT